MKFRFWSPKFKIKRASHRLRGQVLAGALNELGYNAEANHEPLENIGPDTVVVFLKGSTPDQIQTARRQGAFTIYDLCDNKFDEKSEYTPCCAAADLITVNTPQMGASVHQHTGLGSAVIPDPAERPTLTPHFNPGRDIRLLWFGNVSSLKFVPLSDIWAQLEKHIGNYEFTLCTGDTERIRTKMHSRVMRNQIRGVNLNRIRYVEWTWETQGQELERTDIVFIPVVNVNYRTDTKSANRVIDSLVSGRYVITTPLASYTEFAPYTWQRDSIAGIQWSRQHPSAVLDQISRGQQYAIENYSAKQIATKLVETINAARARG